MDNSIMLLVLLLILLGVTSWFALPGPWALLIIKTGRSLASLKSRSVNCDGVDWHYLEGGSGPVLLLLHGFGGDADNWLKVGRVLSKNFRIIAPDLPGFGTSGRVPGGSFDIDSQLQRLKSFLELLKVSPEFIAGNSMGGWLASAYASRFPAGLKGLWLLAPLGVRGARPSLMLSNIEKGSGSPLCISNQKTFETRVLEPMFGKVPWIPFPLRNYYGKQAIERSTTATADFKQLVESPEALNDLAAEIGLPVLLQWGSNDQAVDVSGAEILKRAFADVQVHVQAGVGHLPMLETPGVSVALFSAFQRRCNQATAPQSGTSR